MRLPEIRPSTIATNRTGHRSAIPPRPHLEPRTCAPCPAPNKMIAGFSRNNGNSNHRATDTCALGMAVSSSYWYTVKRACRGADGAAVEAVAQYIAVTQLTMRLMPKRLPVLDAGRMALRHYRR